MPPVRRARANQRALPPQIVPPVADFESQLRDSQPEDAIVAPEDGSNEAAVATTVDSDTLESDTNSAFNNNIVDMFNGIDWTRLPRYCRPLASQT